MVDEKRKCQPQPTPTIQPDDTEDWESGTQTLSLYKENCAIPLNMT